jgi:hypothetical protein
MQSRPESKARTDYGKTSYEALIEGRRKVLYGQLKVHLGDVFRGLAQHKESRIEEGHLSRP